MFLNLKLKLYSMVLLLVLYYFWSPYFISYAVSDVDYYKNLVNVDSGYVIFASLSSFIVFIVSFVFYQMLKSIYDSKASRFGFLENDFSRSFNRKVAKYSVFIFSITSIPLIFLYLLSGGGGREDLYSIVLEYRQNVFISVLFSVALTFSIVELYYGNNKYFIILFFIGVVPELFFGTRVGVFRAVFIAAVVFPWNFRIMSLGFLFLVLIGFSRSIFTGYSSQTLYDFAILFFGDPINVYLGNFYVMQLDKISCGIDGLHVFKSILPPIGVRFFFEEEIGDIANCMGNKYSISGLGNSVLNELYISPFSVFSAVFFLFFLSFLIRFSSFNNILFFYFFIMLISMYPYIFRNGIIATANHLITVIIWFLIPLYLFYKMKNYNKKR